MTNENLYTHTSISNSTFIKTKSSYSKASLYFCLYLLILLVISAQQGHITLLLNSPWLIHSIYDRLSFFSFPIDLCSGLHYNSPGYTQYLPKCSLCLPFAFHCSRGKARTTSQTASKPALLPFCFYSYSFLHLKWHLCLENLSQPLYLSSNATSSSIALAIIISLFKASILVGSIL